MQSKWITALKKLILACLLALAPIAPVGSTSFSTDNSDLWLTRNEDGWGVQMVHRADVMFATIYVYGEDRFPIYYTATLFYTGTNSSGDAVWVGDLYLTNGPWFAAPVFNSSEVTYRKVGQIAYVPQLIESGLLAYSVDGRTISKQIYRYTLRNDDYNGTFVGAFKVTATGCSIPADNGSRLIRTTFTVTQTASSLRIVSLSDQGVSCNYPGDYQQFGQFGQTRGAFLCSTGENGGYTLFEMNVGYDDIRGRMFGTNNLGCTLSGNFSAIRQ
jgi:hypothetical protein